MHAPNCLTPDWFDFVHRDDIDMHSWHSSHVAQYFHLYRYYVLLVYPDFTITSNGFNFCVTAKCVKIQIYIA